MRCSDGYNAKSVDKNTMNLAIDNKDNYSKDTLEGIVTVIGHGFDVNGNFLDGEILHKHNLILNGAREIMRNSIIDGGESIKKIIFGDLGKDDTSSTSELTNVPSPSETDTSLVRKIGEKVFSRDKIIKTGLGSHADATGRPGIRYEILLEKQDLVEDGRNKFILEMGLATADDKLFSRLTTPVIIKTPSLQLTLIWEILF